MLEGRIKNKCAGCVLSDLDNTSSYYHNWNGKLSGLDSAKSKPAALLEKAVQRSPVTADEAV